MEVKVDGFNVGTIVSLHYKVVAETEQVVMNFLSAPDSTGRIFHFNPRYHKEKTLVLNTRKDVGDWPWGEEERPSGFPFEIDKEVHVTVKAESDGFLIKCNGHSFQYKFKYRGIPFTNIYHITVNYGTLRIENASYLGIVNPQSNKSIKDGDNVTLFVSTIKSGPQTLSFKWKKDSGELTDTRKYHSTGVEESNLKISSFSAEEQGKYSCTVSNGHWSVESGSAELVLDPASPKVFRNSLSPIDLVAWLSQQFQAKGLTLEDSLEQKLIDDHINGAAFMHLEGRYFDEMGVTKVQCMHILQIIQSVKDGKEKNSPQTKLTLSDTPGVVLPMDVQPQSLTFSEDMSYELLAVWLTNHPKLVGGYQQDISKLKDARITGYVLLTLDESRLKEFGVSYGFKVTLVNIIENLKTSVQPQFRETLSSQQPSLGSIPTATNPRHQPVSPTTDKKTKFDQLPILKELMTLKYIEKGEEKKIRIIKEACHKWKDIASLICDDHNTVSVLEQQHPGKPHDCLRQTLIDEFLNKDPPDYSHDWSGLIELLDDVDLEELAKRVKHALSHT